jgi:hypothetical protein
MTHLDTVRLGVLKPPADELLIRADVIPSLDG